MQWKKCFRCVDAGWECRGTLLRSGSFHARSKQIVPLRSESLSQFYQRWQCGKVFAGLEALRIPDADANFFGQFFLCKALGAPEPGDILTELRSQRTRCWFLGRHPAMVAIAIVAEHEALPRLRRVG